MSERGVCPQCGANEPWRFSDVRYGFPPTGGDYDWMETDATATCPACAESFEVRVRIDLNTGEISQLTSPPFSE